MREKRDRSMSEVMLGTGRRGVADLHKQHRSLLLRLVQLWCCINTLSLSPFPFNGKRIVQQQERQPDNRDEHSAA